MKQFFKYLLVGLVNTGIGYVIIFSCMYLLKLGPVVSNAAGYGIGMTISYALNRDFTFDRQAKGSGTATRFALVSLLAYSANLGMLLLLIDGVGVHAGVAQVLAGIVYVGTSFIVNKFYVFRARPGAYSPPA